MIDGHKGHFMESITPVRIPLYHARSNPLLTKRYNGYMSQFEGLDHLMNLWNSIQENGDEKRDALSD